MGAVRTTTPLRTENIPDELKALRQWVVWKWEERNGKPTKPPRSAHTGEFASSTDSRSWATFEQALQRYGHGGYAGIGFVLSPDDPYVGIDLDHCRDAETKIIEPWALDIVGVLNSYTEISPSGTGLHIFVRGALPDGGRKKGNVEMYDRERYLTVTGDHRDGTPHTIEERGDELAKLHLEVFGNSATVEELPAEQAKPPLDISDEDLIEKAIYAKNGAKFAKLWDGDTTGYPSASEADLALCSLLRFWTAGDSDRMDRMFRASGLFRDKWDVRHGEGTYGDRTINTVLSLPGETYTAARPQTNGSRPPLDADLGVVEDDEHVRSSRFARTDSGNAEMFAHLYGEHLRFDHRRKRWLRWSEHRWSSDPDAGVRRQAKASARKRYADAAQIDDLKDREAEAKWAITSESRMKLDAALSLAQAERPLADSGEGWDADPWLLGVANGVVDLRTGELRDGRQSDRVTMSTTVPYEPDASAPRWERFLDEVFAGDTSLVDYVQRASGYSLSGDTREQCFFVAWGTGWNGKSTLLRVLRDVAGDYAANTPFTTLEQAGRYNIPNDLAALYGKRLVTASELNEAARLNEARLKMLAGQDPVTARFLYGEPFTFVPAAKFWLAVNHKPVVHDDSTGFWRKVRLLPFVESFEGRADPTLEDALRREYPGILSWMVRGCRLWLEEGLEPPASVRVATEEYQAESDPLADFLGEKCVSDAAVTVRAGVLYKAYKSWAESAGLKDKEVLTNTRFGATVRNRFRREHDRQGWFYTGIGLRS